MVSLTIENKKISENDEGKVKVPKEIYVISQEIKIVKNLSCCDLKLRERQFKKLRKWFQIRSKSSFEYTKDDLLRIWKGLFYCFWMSDKPLIQEELAEEYGSLIECFGDLKTSLNFFDAFLKTMCTEWFGLDQWRLDKFLMLIRRMLRYTLLAIRKRNWPEESIQDFNFYIAESVLDNDLTGMILHLVDIFLDELAKTSNGSITSDAVAEFIKPFIIYLAKQRNPKALGEVRNKIFYQLLWQSDFGRDHQEKFDAWKEMGFPNINLNELEKIEEKSELDDETISKNDFALDPRAGNVDVFIPVLPVDTKPIVDVFEKILANEIANAKSKKFIITIIDKYNKFENGVFPLGIKKMPRAELEPLEPLLEKKVRTLGKLDDELHGVDRNLKKLSKKKRRKLLASIDLEDVDESNYDNILKEALSKSKGKKEKGIKSESLLPNLKKRKIVMEWIEEVIDTTKRNKMDKSFVNGESKAINHQIKKNNNSFENIIEDNLNKQSEEILNINKIEKKIESEWDEQLKDGEIEYFVSSTKIKINEANKKFKQNNGHTEEEINLVFNPFAKLNTSKSKKPKNILLGKVNKKEKFLNLSLPEKKKVKIALGKNMVQKPSEYIRQIRNSPQVPYDADKKPTKSLLKPNQIPSPINPFYKKKQGLQLNDTF